MDARRSSTFHQLTGLRGLAAIIVMTSHMCSLFADTPLQHLDTLGGVGVHLFFTLSGFLMGHLYLNKPFTPSALKSFVLARIGRVLPLYVVWLPIACGLDALDRPGEFARDLSCVRASK